MTVASRSTGCEFKEIDRAIISLIYLGLSYCPKFSQLDYVEYEGSYQYILHQHIIIHKKNVASRILYIPEYSLCRYFSWTYFWMN